MNKKKVLDEIRVFILMLLVISSLRSALADWNDVPTGSMKPTIQEGDRVVVNKAVPMTKPSGPFDDEEQGMTFVADEVLAGKLHKVMFTPQIPAVRTFAPYV